MVLSKFFKFTIMIKYLSALLIILVFSFSNGNAQTTTYTIEGDVIEAKNSELIPSTNVFLVGTTLGTQADSKGHFVIKNVTSGNYQLVASMVGFQTFSQKITVSNKKITINISMLEDVKSLDEVKVVGERDKAWEKRYKVFEREFLGNNFDKKEVKILNKEVLDFHYKEGLLSANAEQPLVIENKTLGYKITYILKGFEKNKTKTYYKGIPRYEQLIPKNIEEERAWEKNRKNAYKGSLSHFLKSLLDDRLEQEGFDAHFVNPNFVKKANRRILFYELSDRNVPLRPKEIIQKNNDEPFLYRLLWTYPLEVVYNKQGAGMPVFSDAPHPYTLLVPLNTIFVTDNGNLLDPYAVEIRGKMGELGYADLLPLDYLVSNENSDLK
jgi:CarboxypepD_reg-like domain